MKIVKKIIWEPGRTFGEFSLLTGFTDENHKLKDISLKTKLTKNLELKIPLLSAAMTSVTGYKMALALGKSGGIGILPVQLSIKKQVDIVTKIKKHDLAFVKEPLTVTNDKTIREVVEIVEHHGLSHIPIVDKFQHFLGMFVQEIFWEKNISSEEKVTEAMIPFDKKRSKTITACYNPGISVKEAKQKLKNMKGKYFVVLDKQNRLIKMAFKQDIEDIKVGVAISSYSGWEERVKKNIKAGADIIVIDTSDAYSVFVERIIKKYKKMKLKVPLCAGNVITYEGAMCLMKAGADIIKIGMSSGSICSTQREKATGRGPMTTLLECAKARNDFYKKTRKYVPIIVDGGVSSPPDMIVSLTEADAVMMGGYFNRFFEAAGPKLDKDKKPTKEERKMEYVETWGEGSQRARRLDRYGHAHRKTFFEEGVEGVVPFRGRLKPNLEKDMTKIKAALSNTGCKNLIEFRKNAVLELNSIYTTKIVSNTHDLEEKQ